MRILLPSIVDPLPHPGGAGAATRGFLALLRGPQLHAEVDVVAPSSPLPHAVRQLIALARSSLSAWPSKALFLNTWRFRRAVARRLATRHYDLMLLNGSDLLWMLSQLPTRTPALLYAHNLERDLFASQLDNLGAPLRWARRLLLRDLDKLARYERNGMRTIGRVLFISAADQAQMQGELDGLQTLHVPPLFDYDASPRRRRARPEEPPALGFLANFTWWPNRVGLQWLLHHVLPYVTRDLRLHLFGESSMRVQSSDPRVVPHGFVEDIDAVFARCDVMVCPTVSGAGVNIKFAEALYNGVPVLATPFAARGLTVPGGPGVAIAEGAEEWVRLLNGDGLARLAAQNVPLEASRTFAPRTHAPAVHAFLRATVSGSDPVNSVTPSPLCAASH